MYYRNDIGTTTAPFSPPTHDDPIFYIRYPNQRKNSNTADGGGDVKSLTEALQKHQDSTTASNSKGAAQAIFEKSHSSVDFTKHTQPCQMFIGGELYFFWCWGYSDSVGLDRNKFEVLKRGVEGWVVKVLHLNLN